MIHLKVHEDTDLIRTEFRDLIDLYIHICLHIYHPRTFTKEEREVYKKASHGTAFQEPIDLEAILKLPTEEERREKILEHFEQRAIGSAAL